jgi:uncharacterized membrane protein
MANEESDKPSHNQSIDGVVRSLEAIDSADSSNLSSEIVRDLGKRLERIVPAGDREKVKHVVAEVITHHIETSFSGPLPPPELLNQYPDEARRVILEMALKEQAARHDHFSSIDRANHRLIDLENKDLNYSYIGLILGFLIVIGIAGIGVFALTRGYERIAILCISISLLGGLAKLFIKGRDESDSEKLIKTDAKPKTSTKRRR